MISEGIHSLVDTGNGSPPQPAATTITIAR